MFYILGIDQGTTGTTVVLFGENGNMAHKEYSEHKQYYPKTGWVEHDPEEIWNNTYQLINDTVSNSKITFKQIKAIGITNQRETTVLWDRETGKAVYPAIVWQCGRTQSYCDKLKTTIDEKLINDKTGLVLNPYFSASKINWIIQNVKGVRDKITKNQICFGTIDSWLIYKLSAGKDHITDYTNASRTLLFNIHDLTWDIELLDLFEIDKNILPRVVHSSGKLSKSDAKLFSGFSIDITGIAGDQQAALFGQNCWEEGELKNTYGTGCFFMLNTGKKAIKSKNGLLTTIACNADGNIAYALEGSIFMAGAIIQWLRDELKLISSAKETEDIAESVKDNAGVYVVPAFTGLGAPYWISQAKAAIFGLSRGSGKEHIVRASLEAIAYQTKGIIDLIKLDLHFAPSELKVDGGASENNFLMQFQADILGIKVNRPKITETTVLGAAMLAAKAIGFWTDEKLTTIREVDELFSPNINETEYNKLYLSWKNYVNAVVKIYQ
jgi:glycerol kinase